MGIAERYGAYADAFEESYIDDDWSRIEEFFTDNAVYEGDPDAEGREAVLAKLKAGIDGFDRKMDSRTPGFQTPTVDGNVLTMKWTVTYTKSGVPDLVISGSRLRSSRATASPGYAMTSTRTRRRRWASGWPSTEICSAGERPAGPRSSRRGRPRSRIALETTPLDLRGTMVVVPSASRCASAKDT